MIKLLVTDLDGTVVRKDGSISDRVRKGFAACQSKGLRLCVATGRVRKAVMALNQEFSICHGGTLVMQGNSVLHRTTMNVEQVARIWQWANERQVDAILFGEDSWSVNFAGDETAMLERFLCAPPSGAPVGEVPLARLRCPASDLAPVFGDLHLEQEGPWTYLRKAQADKGPALQHLMKHLELNANEVLCFGDELNDLPMFAVAGHSVAVENAHPALRAAATRIVPSVEDDGVALVLEELSLA